MISPPHFHAYQSHAAGDASPPLRRGVHQRNVAPSAALRPKTLGAEEGGGGEGARDEGQGCQRDSKRQHQVGRTEGVLARRAAEEAEARHANGEKVVLVRAETSPEDIVGMVASEAILTMRGGMTSHAAVVARGMGKCCVCGCGSAVIDEEAKTVTINGKVYTAEDTFSIDGSTGNVYLGAIKTVSPDLTAGYFGRLMGWVDEMRALKVRTNADTPRDAKQAVIFGAQGIGLCRTEHMFFDKDLSLIHISEPTRPY